MKQASSVSRIHAYAQQKKMEQKKGKSRRKPLVAALSSDSSATEQGGRRNATLLQAECVPRNHRVQFALPSICLKRHGDANATGVAAAPLNIYGSIF